MTSHLHPFLPVSLCTALPSLFQAETFIGKNASSILTATLLFFSDSLYYKVCHQWAVLCLFYPTTSRPLASKKHNVLSSTDLQTEIVAKRAKKRIQQRKKLWGVLIGRVRKRSATIRCWRLVIRVLKCMKECRYDNSQYKKSEYRTMFINWKVNWMWQLWNAEKGCGIVKRVLMSGQEELMFASLITRDKERDLILCRGRQKDTDK